MVIKRGQFQPLSLKQLFEANFAPRGHLAISRDIFGCDNLRGGEHKEHPSELRGTHNRVIQLKIPGEPATSNIVLEASEKPGNGVSRYLIFKYINYELYK